MPSHEWYTTWDMNAARSRLKLLTVVQSMLNAFRICTKTETSMACTERRGALRRSSHVKPRWQGSAVTSRLTVRTPELIAEECESNAAVRI